MKNKSLNLLEGSIGKVLFSLAIPIIMSNFIQTLLGIVDMIWIGKLGGEAVSAIGTASFYINLASALTTLVVVGAGVKVAHALGEGNKREAQTLIKGSIVLSVLISLIFVGLVYFNLDALIAFFNMNHPKIESMARSYLQTSLFGVPFLFLVTILTTVMTSYGDTKQTFKANSIGLGFNIIADPIFIFGFGMIPALGINGAAWATNIARVIIFVLLIRYSNQEIKDSFKVKVDFRKMIQTMKMSVPVTIQRLVFIYISMIMAKIIVRFGTEAIAVQKIGVQIESISYVTIGGLQGAIAAFVGQNYGNKNYTRIKEGYTKAIRMVLIFGIVISSLFILFPKPIFSIFIQETLIIDGGVGYMQAIGFSQLFMCVELLTVGAFNGMGKTYIPPLVSITLTLIRIPLALVLSSVMGVAGVWWSISISSILKGLVLFVWFKFDMTRLLRQEVQNEVAI